MVRIANPDQPVLFSMLLCPYAGRAHPFPFDEKDAKILSKLSFSPRHDFFFPAHWPGYPPKILPSNAGPGYFDWPSRFSPDGEVGEFFFLYPERVIL
jgi:hypothetical protein